MKIYKNTPYNFPRVSLVIFGACMNPSSPGPVRAGQAYPLHHQNLTDCDSELFAWCRLVIASEGNQAEVYRFKLEQCIHTRVLYQFDEAKEHIANAVRTIITAPNLGDSQKLAMLQILLGSVWSHEILKRKNRNRTYVACCLLHLLDDQEVYNFLAQRGFFEKEGYTFLGFIWKTNLRTGWNKKNNKKNAAIIVEEEKETFSFPEAYPFDLLMLELLKINNMSSKRLIWCLLSLGAYRELQDSSLHFYKDVSGVLQELWDENKDDQASHIVYFLFEDMFNQRDVYLNGAFAQSVMRDLLHVYSGLNNREMCLKIMRMVMEAMEVMDNLSQFRSIPYQEICSFIGGCIALDNERLQDLFEADFRLCR